MTGPAAIALGTESASQAVDDAALRSVGQREFVPGQREQTA
jgi:hypothetical protein